MAWDGYWTYDGNEIINVARTENYASNAGAHWFRPLFENDALPLMLGDEKYSTPLQDDAPWVDPDIPQSVDFWGVYPLDITGVEDSTRTSTPVESLGDGGTPGRLRHATKSMVFNVVLVAGTDAGAEYGMRWLRQALLGGVCGPSATSACSGAEMCYLASEPELEEVRSTFGTLAHIDGGRFSAGDDQNIDPADGGSPDDTYVSEVDGGAPGNGHSDFLAGGTAGFTNVSDLAVDTPLMDGGSPTALSNMSFDGGSPSVTGGLTDGTQFPFDTEQQPEPDPVLCLPPLTRSLRRVIVNNGPTLTAKRSTSDGGAVWTATFTAVAGVPWMFSTEQPVIAGFLDPHVSNPWVGDTGGSIDLDGYIHPEAACAVTVYEPVYDPLTPALSIPPGPPSIPMGHYVPPKNWRRRQFTIPREYVPSWGEVVPKVQVHAVRKDLRNLRLRFYADPYDIGDISEDPCAYCGDIVISYVPKDHTLTLDGVEETVYMTSQGGGRRLADSLVFKTDGGPFEWPALTCGYGYVVTVDLPQTQTPPVVDLSLYSRAV